MLAAGHDDLLQAIAAMAREMFAAGACSLALLDAETDELVFDVAAGGGEIVGTRIAVGHGIAGWVAASGQPIAVDDVREDPRFARSVAEDSGYMPRAIVAMPIESEHEVLGVIEILDPGPDMGHGFALLELFARQVALAISSQRVLAGLARLAVLVGELGRLGPGEREAATRLIDDLLASARTPRQ
jgi:GAF domain-containing protein